jgi:formamidopyrimidine-DNA glycosylase
MGKAFKATSPNARFTEGAQAIDRQPLTRIEVHGKNLFYFFANNKNNTTPAILHFHFGMSGAFGTFSPELCPHPTPTTRLRLETLDGTTICHLSAMTVKLLAMNDYTDKVASLGQDPLREDADESSVWEVIKSSRKPIGLLLMDQSVIAGIGNIYRAEILFKAGVHPEQPGNTISRDTWKVIWDHSVDLLQRGFESGSILTVDPEEAVKMGSPWNRRYIYNHSRCGRCRGVISSWDMSGRKVYCCETCQPLSMEGGVAGLDGSRQQAIKSSKGEVEEFVSHCAPDIGRDISPAKMTISQLKNALTDLGVDVAGVGGKKKSELAAALQTALLSKSVEDNIGESTVLTPPLKRYRKRVIESVKKEEEGEEEGEGDKKMATAAEAALEKIKAGEGANVEHVALQDDATRALRRKARR